MKKYQNKPARDEPRTPICRFALIFYYILFQEKVKNGVTPFFQSIML